MHIRPASLSTVSSIGQCLLRSIESENALPEGLFGDKLHAPGESTQTLDLGELRACISATIDLLKHQLLETAAAVCRRHNALLPIQRLPLEILSACIGCALHKIGAHNHQARLIQLSTVSSWWRQVTLNTPSLWNVIHSKDPDWIVSLALERSKDAPLTVIYERGNSTETLNGFRTSMKPDAFLNLVSSHTNRWRSATLPLLGPGPRERQWLTQHKVQISRRLRLLSLSWSASPNTDHPITGFSGSAERLRELRLCNLHVNPTDITSILARSHRLIFLELESLVALNGQEEALPDNEPNDTSHTSIHLPYLEYLKLSGIPSPILRLIVQNLDPSTISSVIIDHDMGINQDWQGTHPDPLAFFISRLVALEPWLSVCPYSTKLGFSPLADGPCRWVVELRGPLSAVLPWFSLRCLAQITQKYSVKLYISSEDIGDNPEQVVVDTLMRFPNVGDVKLLGSSASWRWMWLLSLPNVVQTDSGDLETRRGLWLWPNLKCLSVNGDHANEFMVLSVLLARQGPRSTGTSITRKDGVPCQLETLRVRPRENVWQPEVLDRIRELLGPGRFKWVLPK